MKISELTVKHDPEKLFEVLRDSYTQIQDSFDTQFSIAHDDKLNITSVVITGLGGSAIAGDFFRNLFRSELKVPVLVNRNYGLPEFCNKGTLVIVSSYSGSTEETLSSFEDAVNRGCKIFCISTGGELVKRAKAKNIPCFVLKPGFQPRYSFGLSFTALVRVLAEYGVIPHSNEFLQNSIALWKNRGEELSSEGNSAFQLAVKLLGTVPVIYGVADYTDSIVMRTKSQFNENSKVHSYFHNFPELNHNEIIGWETHAASGLKFSLLVVSDEIYHPQVKRRIEITSELIRKQGTEVYMVSSEKSEFGLRLMDIIYYLDWVTYYFAILRGKDPGEIDFIHLLKKRLAE